MPEQLKPCPFCGGKNTAAIETFMLKVSCLDCGTEGPNGPPHSRVAIAVWNTRKGEGVGRTIKTRGCETCPYRWDEKQLRTQFHPNCQADGRRTILRKFGLDEYPDWCPLGSGPMTVERAT